MTDQLAENKRPSNVGDDSTLPRNVRAVAGLRSPTIAWTTMDPKYERNFQEWISDSMISDFIMRVVWVPLWIFIAQTMVLPMWVVVCFLFVPIKSYPHPRNYYWILTETELKIVMVNHEQFFLKGIKQSGDFVRTIPLNSVVACGVEFGKRKPLVPQLYVDIAEPEEDTDGTVTHTAEGLAVAGPDWLAQEILRRRDLLQQDASGHGDFNNTDIQQSFHIAPVLSPRLDNDEAAKDGRLHLCDPKLGTGESVPDCGMDQTGSPESLPCSFLHLLLSRMLFKRSCVRGSASSILHFRWHYSIALCDSKCEHLDTVRFIGNRGNRRHCWACC
jgi:hypothetical protein